MATICSDLVRHQVNYDNNLIEHQASYDDSLIGLETSIASRAQVQCQTVIELDSSDDDNVVTSHERQR